MSSGAFSNERLTGMHAVMAGYVERGEIPGVVTLLSRRGETHVDVLGHKAFGATEAMERDTIFRISSMSTPIPAVAAMMRILVCKLRLDDPVDHLLPELSNRRVLKRRDAPLDDTVPARRPISVRDLLTFRMGFGQVMAPPDAYPILKAANSLDIGMGGPSPATMPPPEEWMRRLGTLPLMYQPGERWMYNTGADVLSVLVARATGRPFDAFLRERTFSPLGMKDTAFSVPVAKRNRLATSYGTNFQTGKTQVVDPVDGQWSKPPAFESGGGGLVSTIDDYFAFAQMLHNRGMHGDQRILSRASVELMTTDQMTPEQKAVSGLVPGFFNSHGWGFLVSVTTKRESIGDPVGKYGWDGGMGTCWYSDPNDDLIGILLTQRAWTSPSPPDVCRDFWTLAYSAIDG